MEIVFAKLWERHKFEEIDNSNFLNEVSDEFKKSAGKIRYWISDTMISKTKNPLKKLLLKTSRKMSS